jgi:hypothetical protein
VKFIYFKDVKYWLESESFRITKLVESNIGFATLGLPAAINSLPEGLELPPWFLQTLVSFSLRSQGVRFTIQHF